MYHVYVRDVSTALSSALVGGDFHLEVSRMTNGESCSYNIV